MAYDPRYAAYLAQLQTAAPNQMPLVSTPYRPDVPIDLGIAKNGDNYQKPPGESYTQHVYDSKPPAFETLYIQEGTSVLRYKVPDGKILILRNLSIRAYSHRQSYAGIASISDDPPSHVLHILVDDQAVNLHAADEGYNSSDINIDAVHWGTANLDLFIPINGGSLLTIHTIYYDANGTFSTREMMYGIYGDILNATGRSIQMECGNMEPLPVIKGIVKNA
jgi:hypothetical protein